jgi:D-3-phosphoglycerate dehydrogenase / 2-oxoglutarate reductase
VGRYDRSVRSGEWEYTTVRPLRRLRTLTVGVIGCGHIGAEFARKVGCLGARVLGHDTARMPEDLVHDGVLEPANLDELLAQADAVSLHAPLTEQTRHLIGAEQLRRMKPDAYLVNTSRGDLVDQAALLRALDQGEIAGAALDVLETEPPEAGDPLVTHERVLITPHAGWYSEESMGTLKSEVAREVVRVLSGERPRSPVNEPIGREPDA